MRETEGITITSVERKGILYIAVSSTEKIRSKKDLSKNILQSKKRLLKRMFSIMQQDSELSKILEGYPKGMGEPERGDELQFAFRINYRFEGSEFPKTRFDYNGFVPNAEEGK